MPRGLFAPRFPQSEKGVIANQVAKRDAEGAVAAVASLFEFLERLTRSALDRRPRE
jgi:hypothetical protein